MLIKRTNTITCEVAYVLLGETTGGVWHAKMMWRRTGEPASVDFDWHKVLTREEKKGDVVGFYHTHPNGLKSPSARDDRTMDAWSTCFGKPLLCLISDGDGIGGWVYDADKDGRTRLSEVHKFRNHWLVAIL